MNLLLDSASLWYRAFYGMPDSLRSPSGAPVNAIRGFLDSVARLTAQYKPNQVIACLDGDWRPSWRTELLPEYKAARDSAIAEDEERAQEEIDLESQVPIILDILDAIGLPVIGIDDYEADDVIATLATREAQPSVIATGDRDLFQLVDDAKPIKVAYLAKGISSHELVDLQWIAERYSIPGERYALMALLRGDPSDGLPGVRGIGEKGAAKIVTHFASVAEIVEAAIANDSRLTAAICKKILDGREYLRRAEPVVQCVRDLRLPPLPGALPKRVLDQKRIDEIVTEFGVGTSVNRLLAALALD
ncbi:MAG: 5'-3' exonuclease [Actinobacteria bacterium]|nr:5'-3' exonuclease [Actinomycetota bacterium]